MKYARKPDQSAGTTKLRPHQASSLVSLRGLRKEKRRLLRQLKQIRVEVGISEMEYRDLCYQAIQVVTLGFLLRSRRKMSLTVSNGVS